jgi:selenocysteine lyase/cysteine desulfurase
MNNQLLQCLQREFLGLGTPTEVATLTGGKVVVPRVYLDAAATCLMPKSVWQTEAQYLTTSCANGHTDASAVGRATTEALLRVHQLIGQLVGADPTTDTVILCGSGATEPTNLLASAMFSNDPRPLVCVSAIEHHSNLLPWMRAAGRDNVRLIDCLDDGSLDIAHLTRVLIEERGKVRAVTVTGVSNVTGVITPLEQIAALTHAAGADLVVDAAQAAAHIPMNMHPGPAAQAIDFLILSGHKLYAPGAPGALIGRKDLFQRTDWSIGNVGGGTVERVEYTHVLWKADPSERYEAGTPNIPGAIALGAAAKMLLAVGMDTVRAHEVELVRYAFEKLGAVPEILIYGPRSTESRAGVFSFNLSDMPHGLVAAALSDYAAIAVRNDCFCAQPYVRQQLQAACDTQGFCLRPDDPSLRGMVRASFALFTTKADIDRLAAALTWIGQHRNELNAVYESSDDRTHFHHKTFRPATPFSLDSAADGCLARSRATGAATAPSGQVSGGQSAPKTDIRIPLAIAGAVLLLGGVLYVRSMTAEA